jgi:hypothetical protein
MINSGLKTCYICHQVRPDVTWRRDVGFYACERCWSDFRHNRVELVDDAWHLAFAAAMCFARAEQYSKALIYLTLCEEIDEHLRDALDAAELGNPYPG